MSVVDLFDELLGITRALDEAGVEYALCGGLAVAVWGALAGRPQDLADIARLREIDR
jgi:hypothetical protein